MAKNMFSHGSPLDVTVPSGGCTSGVPFVIGGIVHIPETTGAAGDTVAAHVTGVFDVPSDTGAAWSYPDVVYWDDTNKRLTKTSSGNTKCGFAAAAKTSAATTGRVRFQPVF